MAARRRRLGWGIFNAVWTGDDGNACRAEGTGACWPFIAAKLGLFIYGRYPEAQRWRVDLVYVLALAALVPLMVPQIPGKAERWLHLLIFPCWPSGCCWQRARRDRRRADAIGLILPLSASLPLLARFESTSPRPRRCASSAALSLAIAVPLSCAGFSRPAASSSCRRSRPNCGAACSSPSSSPASASPPRFRSASCWRWAAARSCRSSAMPRSASSSSCAACR